MVCAGEKIFKDLNHVRALNCQISLCVDSNLYVFFFVFFLELLEFIDFIYAIRRLFLTVQMCRLRESFLFADTKRHLFA